MSNRILSIVSILLAASTAVHAIGDFPCSGTTDSQSCAAWSTDKDAQGVISPDAVCQPGKRCRAAAVERGGTLLTVAHLPLRADPVYPNISYCGYAHAACSNNTQCDYGKSSCSKSG